MPALATTAWLDTGDMGYMSEGYLYIVGRAKDMIIINGKNHWPQDIEWAVSNCRASRRATSRLLDHHARRRGRPGGAGPVPHLRRGRRWAAAR
jgi:acyl-CoA synthetase (AMP-forming)/AMP-acid ligase II